MTRSARTHQASRFAGGRPCSIKGDKMNRPNRNLFAALSGISWLALCPPVMAQQNEAPATAVSEEDGSAPGDIVVMARKRSQEHTSELQSLMRTSYAIFCLKKPNPLT